jgi:hypothetical protein
MRARLRLEWVLVDALFSGTVALFIMLNLILVGEKNGRRWCTFGEN